MKRKNVKPIELPNDGMQYEKLKFMLSKHRNDIHPMLYVEGKKTIIHRIRMFLRTTRLELEWLHYWHFQRKESK